eukprot:4610618-Pleurochrysis_carterae.AAC.1
MLRRLQRFRHFRAFRTRARPARSGMTRRARALCRRAPGPPSAREPNRTLSPERLSLEHLCLRHCDKTILGHVQLRRLGLLDARSFDHTRPPQRGERVQMQPNRVPVEPTLELNRHRLALRLHVCKRTAPQKMLALIGRSPSQTTLMHHLTKQRVLHVSKEGRLCGLRHYGHSTVLQLERSAQASWKVVNSGAGRSNALARTRARSATFRHGSANGS